jgi:hypothetical protein
VYVFVGSFLGWFRLLRDFCFFCFFFVFLSSALLPVTIDVLSCTTKLSTELPMAPARFIHNR